MTDELQECKDTVRYLTEKQLPVVQKATVEVAGIKAVVDEHDNWQTISMIIVLVLGIYLGIKLINKVVR